MRRVIRDGWRYLRLKPNEVMALTPLEFHDLMEAEIERNYDEFSRQAEIAIMHEKARRSKRPKARDLFKRPQDDVRAVKRAEVMREKAAHAQAWLDQFDFSNANLRGKEDASGGCL